MWMSNRQQLHTLQSRQCKLMQMLQQLMQMPPGDGDGDADDEDN